MRAARALYRTTLTVVVVAGALTSCGSDRRGSNDSPSMPPIEYDPSVGGSPSLPIDPMSSARGGGDLPGVGGAPIIGNVPLQGDQAACGQAGGTPGSAGVCLASCAEGGTCPSGFGRCAAVDGRCQHDELDDCWVCAQP